MKKFNVKYLRDRNPKSSTDYGAMSEIIDARGINHALTLANDHARELTKKLGDNTKIKVYRIHECQTLGDSTQ